MEKRQNNEVKRERKKRREKRKKKERIRAGDVKREIEGERELLNVETNK